MNLKAQIFKNKATNQLIMVDKNTGKVYAQRMHSGMGYVPYIDLSDIDQVQTAESDTSGSWFSSINWDAIGNTINDITTNPLFQDLISDVSFESGQFQFGGGGDTVTTTNPVPPPPTQSGFDYKPILYVGGALAAAAVIAYVVKNK